MKGLPAVPSPVAGADSALCALVLSALPIIRVGIANLIRAEFGREARVLSADWAARHQVLAAGEARFHLVVAHWIGEVRPDEVSRLASAARGAALVVVRPRPGPALRAPPAHANLRWITLDALPEDWRRVMRATLFHARGDAGNMLGATAERRPPMPPRAGARQLPLGVAPGLLTRRQADVFDMLGAGLSNKTIAERLALSVGTVKLHVAATLRALNAKRRVDIILRRAGVQPPLRDARLGPTDENAD